jgi:RES domain-containing protein
VASDAHTAIAEARPWIGSLVTLSPFRIRRSLRIINCTQGGDRQPLYIDGEPSRQKKIDAVWSHIARAFREPVKRGDDVADYAATQIVAEVFRNQGYDGLAYRSAFGKDQFNIALFDLEAAEPLMASLHKIKTVALTHEEIANPYYIQRKPDGSTTRVRNVITEIRPVNSK